MPLNTRAKKREPVQTLAEYSINASTEKSIKLNIPEASVKASILDISVLGCGLDSPYMLPAGVIIDIKIESKPFAAQLGLQRKEPLQVVGRITSCIMKTAGHYRVGVCFTKIDKSDIELIDNFIKSKDRRQAPRWDMSK